MEVSVVKGRELLIELINCGEAADRSGRNQ